MTNAHSVKVRLKNQAMEDGTTMQDKLVTFALERTVYRISISKYAERFTLKGGIFMYALFDGNFARATMDIDLLAQKISADAERMKEEFPVLLDMPAPVVYAYSISSVIAEKFEAIVSLGYANSRYKDFYDIYALAAKYDLSGIELQQSIIETFRNRQTEFHDIVAFEEDFSADPTRQKRWAAFIKKKKAMLDISLDEAVKLLKNFLGPVADSIQAGETFDAVWNADEQMWKQ